VAKGRVSRPRLGAAVAFRRPDEGRRAGDAEKGQLFLEVVDDVLRAVIVPDGEPGGDLVIEPAEALPHALPDRLQGLKAGGAAAGMNDDLSVRLSGFLKAPYGTNIAHPRSCRSRRAGGPIT
jgi:hypothetical protein